MTILPETILQKLKNFIKLAAILKSNRRFSRILKNLKFMDFSIYRVWILMKYGF